MNEPELKMKLRKLMQEGENLRARIEAMLEADSSPHGATASERVSNIKMPYDLQKELRVNAAVRETTRQEYVVEAIKSRLVQEKKQEKANGRRKI